MSWLWKCLEHAGAQHWNLHPSGIPWRQAFFRVMVRDPNKNSGFESGYMERQFYARANGFMALLRGHVLSILIPYLDPGKSGPTEEQASLEEDISRYLNVDELVCNESIGEALYWARNTSRTKDISLRKALLAEFCGDLNWPLDEYADFLDFAGTETVWEIVSGITNLAFFITRRGYIGLGSLMTKAGDVVSVLFGCDEPLVIWRSAADAFMNLGGCFVYGMMQGEMVHELEAGKSEVEDFTFE